MTQTVSLSFYRFEGAASRLWAFAQMGLARRALARTPGIGFRKMCGSGTGEGFTPVPNVAVYAILATWPDEATARERTARAPVFARFRARAAEAWTVYLRTVSARGRWSGAAPFEPAEAPPGGLAGPLAALTRATIRTSVLRRFWGRVPAISAVVGRDPHVLFKIGIGEVPWLHQVTFSIWPGEAEMAAFARRGPHAEAIRAVRRDGWFREELYARFAVLGAVGRWDGRAPLAEGPSRIAAE